MPFGNHRLNLAVWVVLYAKVRTKICRKTPLFRTFRGRDFTWRFESIVLVKGNSKALLCREPCTNELMSERGMVQRFREVRSLIYSFLMRFLSTLSGHVSNLRVKFLTLGPNPF